MQTITSPSTQIANTGSFRTWWKGMLTIIAVVFSLTTVNVYAQSTANYTFATNNNGSLSADLNSNTIDMSTGTTQIVGPGLDASTGTGVTNIGFDFFLMSNRFSQFSVQDDGLMQLGGTAVGTNTYTITGGTLTAPRLAAFNADMRTGATTGKIHYKLVGTAPNRCLVVEFKDMWVFYTATGGTGTSTWQMRLYETSGVIEYVYGSMNANDIASLNKSPSIGFYTGSATNSFASVAYATNTSSVTATYAANPAVAATGPITNLNSAADGSRRFYRYTPTNTQAGPTALNFTAVTASTITLNWTAASPTTNVLKYAVYVSTDGGTTYNFVNTTTVGTNTLAVTGLVPSTSYMWRVYSLNEGTLSTTFASGTQATNAAATYTWSAAGGTGVYGTGGNWTPARSTPAASDILIIDGASTPTATITGFATQTVGQFKLTNNASVTMSATAAATLTVAGGISGNDFDIPSGSTLNLSGTVSIGLAFSGTNRSSNIAGTLRTTTTGTGTLNFTNSLTTVSGTVEYASTTNSSTSTTTNLTIGATGTVKMGSNSIVIPVATWNAASTLNITGAVAATSVTNGAQAFGNVIYNCAAATGTMSFFTSSTVTIQNLTIQATNSGRFRALTSGVLNVGSITVNGGTFEVASTSGIINVSGNVTVNGGTLDVTSGTSTATLKIAGNFNQTAGTVNASGTSTTNNIEFNGTVAQTATFGTMGTGPVGVRINNAAGVTLSGTLAINANAALTVSNGSLTGSGTVAYNATSSRLIYNGTAGAQTATAVEFPATAGPTNLTINNTATTPNNVVNIPFARTLGAAAGNLLTLTAGILDNGSNTLTIANTVVGAISGGSASSYVKGPLERALPASLVTGSTYVFPVGKTGYNPFDLVNPTTNAGGTASVLAEVFDGNAGGTAGTLMASISSTRYWAASVSQNAANFTNTFIRLNDTRGTQNGIANSATLTGSYDQIGGTVSTLAAGSITTTAPALSTLAGFYLMGNLNGPVFSNLLITPSGTQCTNVARTVTVTVTPGGGAVTTVTLSYQVNGGAVNNVTMTNTSGNDWSGVIPTVTPSNGTVSWFITAVDANAVQETITGTSYADEPLLGVTATASATPSTICAGTDVTLSTTFSRIVNASIGAGATTSITYPNPVYSNWANNKLQILYLASELTAAGFTAGSFNSLAFNLTATSATARNNFTINMANTGASALTTTFLTPTFTQVYTNASLVPIVGVNTFAFGTGAGSSAGFSWDGTSNVVIQFCWDNIASTATISSTCTADNTAFNSAVSFNRTSTTGISVCGITVTGNTVYAVRPRITFNQNSAPTPTAYSWSDGTNSVGTTNPLVVNPTVTTTYTASITAAGCTMNSTSATVTVNPLPAAPSGAPSSQCGTGVPGVFVAGSSPGNYRWYTVPTGGTPIPGETNAGLNTLNGGTGTYTISTTTTFYVSIFDGTCESLRTPVTASVNAPDAVSASANGPVCANSPLQLTATVTSNTNGNVYNYTWSASPATGSGIPTTQAGGSGTFGTPTSINVTPTAGGTYIYTVNAVDATLGCTTTATVTVTVNAQPVITSATATPNTICAGAPVTLAATSFALSPGSVALGAGGSTSSSGGTPFYGTWGGTKVQYIYTAAELQTAGFGAGNFTAIGLNVTAVGATTYQGFAISIGSTSQSVYATANTVASGTQVFTGPLANNGYQTTSGLNTFNFSTPFFWNGTSNIVVTMCYSNTNSSNPASTIQTDTYAGNVGMYIYADNQSPATVCGATTTIPASGGSLTTTTRPRTTFSGQLSTNITNTLNWSWNNGGGTGASVTVNPVTTPSITYTVTATDANSCSQTADVTVTVNPIPGDPTGTGSEQCGTAIPTASVSSNSSEPTPIFKWYDAPTAGTLLQTDPSTTYLSAVSTTTTFYVSEITGAGCESGRTPVTVTVSAPDVITVSATSTNICVGSSFDLSSSYTPDFNSFATFDLTATGGIASGVTATVPLIPNATGSDPYTIIPTAPGTYVYTVTAFDPDKGCTSIGTVSVTVYAYPPAITSVTATPSTICAGQTAVLTAKILGGTATGTIGAGAVSNTTSTPYKGFFGGSKVQMIYTAAELTTLGLAAGSDISSVGFNITAFTSPYTFNGFTIAMKNTNTSVLTTALETGTTTVFGPTNYTLTGTAPFTVSHTLTSSFVWDGTSNLLVEFCFNNNNGGGVSANSANVASTTTTGFNRTTYYSADNVATVCSAPGTATVTTTRPNIILTYTPNTAGSYNWSWDNGGGTGATVTVSPSTTTTYTATATTPGSSCSVNSSPVTVTVNPLPLAPTTNSPVTRCGPGAVTLTATGAGGTLNWYNVATGGTSLATGGSYAPNVTASTSFWVEETSAAGCIGPRSEVVVTVTTAPTLVITPSGATTFCAGGSVTLDAASASDPSYINFAWTPATGLSATNVASVTANPTTTQTYTVTADDGVSGPTGCSNTATITVTVNPNPVIASVSASPATICVGGNTTLSAQSFGPTSLPGTYCVANSSGGAGSNPITQVTFGNINNAQPTQVSPYSYDYPASGSTTTTVFSGQTYTLDVTSGTASIASVWFDWDRNGVFDASEWTQLWTSATTGTLSVTVPSNAVPGLTGMRIRTRGTGNTNGSGDACTGFFSGTSQTYSITVVGAADPSFNYTWNPGNLSGASVNVSPTITTNYTLTATNPTTLCSTNSSPVTVTVQAVGATASASPSTPVCAGTPVTLGAGATGGGPFGYVWNDGTSNFSNDAAPVVTPTVTTTYTVTVTDVCNNSTTSSVTVTVNPVPVVTVTPTAASFCNPGGTPVTLTASGADSYVWSPAGGLSATTGATVTATPTANVTYTVTGTESINNCSASATAVITVNLNVTGATVGVTPNPICAGSTLNLTASANPISGSYSMNTNSGVAFTDISTTGTSVGTLGDDTEHNITIPSFTFNGVVYTAGRVGTNGKLVLGATTGEVSLSNAALPSTASSAGNIFLAPFWDDLDIQTGAVIYTQTVGNNYIVQFNNMAHNSFTTGSATFQIQMNLTNGIISFVYPDVVFGDVAYDAAASATVGIQYSSSSALQYSFSTASLTNGQSITFTPPSLSYSWTGPNGFTSSLQNPTITNLPLEGAGVYQVTLSTLQGCSVTLSTSAVVVNARPTAVISGSGVFCEGAANTSTNLSVSFTGAGPWTYTVVGSNGFSTTATTSNNPETITVTPSSATPGVITYTVSALSDANCASIGADLTGSGTVTVNPLAATPTANVTQPTCAVATGSITMTAPLGAGNSYTLDGTTTITWPTITFTGVATGSHTITVVNSFGCSAPASLNVTVDPQPFIPTAPVVTGLVNVCPFIGVAGPAGEVTYTATTTGNGTQTFNWILPPNVTVVSGLGTGTLVIRFNTGFATQPNKQLRVTVSNQCGTSAQTIYYLAAQVPVTPGAISGPNTACAFIGSGTATYSVAVVPGTATYLWTVPANASIVTGLGTNSITVSFGSTYATGAITVASVNDCGTSPVRSLTVTRNNPSTPSLISGPTNVCPHILPAGTAATYTVASVPSVTTYTWTVPVGATIVTGQGTNTITVTYPSGFTSGAISVVASNGCGSSSARNLAVGTLQPATPGVIDVINTQTCPNREFTYTIAAMPANATSVLWTVPSGATLVSGQGTTSITVQYPGTAVDGFVTAQGVNNCGVSVIRVVTVKLAACPPPAPFTKGVTEVIAPVETMEVKVFPNPTVSDFKLQVITAGKEEISVRVLDVQGRFIRQFTATAYQTINLGAELKAGAYLIEVRQGKNVKTTRVLKF